MVGSEHDAVAAKMLSRLCRRPLMVGSEQAFFVELDLELRLSPSPHGRVGTSATRRAISFPTVVAVPSWSGRNALANSLTASSKSSPSPHGRVGTNITKPMTDCIVESPSPHGRVGTRGRRDAPVRVCVSPSPHGRVGTPKKADLAPQNEKVAVPSWSGRNGNSSGRLSSGQGVAVPSWSGRNNLPVQQFLSRLRVAVPSWSGRNPANQPKAPRPTEPSPSPHGRVGTSFPRLVS